jgi:hypothetical protein
MVLYVNSPQMAQLFMVYAAGEMAKIGVNHQKIGVVCVLKKQIAISLFKFPTFYKCQNDK